MPRVKPYTSTVGAILYTFAHAAYSLGRTNRNGAPHLAESPIARIRLPLDGVHAMAIFMPSSRMDLKRFATA